MVIIKQAPKYCIFKSLPNSGVSTRVTFQIKRVVESFAAESAKISLNIRVTFHVSVEESLQRERLGANSACELATLFFDCQSWGGGLRIVLLTGNW